MELKFNKEGKLEIDFHELLSNISKDDKLKLLESFACDDVVIQHVTDQLLGGWTENGYCGGSLCTAATDTTNVNVPALDRAWREIAKNSGDIAKREIERLESALLKKDETIRDLRDTLMSESKKYY
jgi:predicted helicase